MSSGSLELSSYRDQHFKVSPSAIYFNNKSSRAAQNCIFYIILFCFPPE